jgi:hypothetical protein
MLSRNLNGNYQRIVQLITYSMFISNLRLFPVAPFVSRNIDTDISHNKMLIPKNSTVLGSKLFYLDKNYSNFYLSQHWRLNACKLD